MSFDAPTVEEVADATGQDFEQVARDFYATAKATEVDVSDATGASAADD
jgi:hypothetical protein